MEITGRFSTRLYCAVKRKLYAKRIEKLTSLILLEYNHEEYQNLFEDRRSFLYEKGTDIPAGMGSVTSMNLKDGIKKGTERYLVYGFDQLPENSKILDLGCGCGYFLAVCKFHGHQVTGLDLSIDSGYNKAMKFFNIDRIDHEISIEKPLPKEAGLYDLITAFLTTFNRWNDRKTWGGTEWMCFLDHIKNNLNTNGIFFVQFNKDHTINKAYSDDVPEMIEKRDDFKTVFFADCMKLIKR
jgi:SAM-dependent methyltransferase